MSELGSFGKYELIERIAAGGMAEVFRARRRGLAGFEKILVIKKILPHLAQEKEFVELFIDEARIAVQLIHVNIVQVFDLGEIDGCYFMAMEYVQGMDLSRVISQTARSGNPFPIPLALFIITEILKALQFAHNRQDEAGHFLNIVHCDISPQNVLISHAGEVKLTDFGISRAAFQLEEQHQVIRGKYAYMAPEQVEGRQLDRKTDLFALTIVLYEMITGRRLFKRKDRNETLRRVRQAEVPSPRDYRMEISEELEGIIYKGLKRRPEDRYADAGEMLMDLSGLMINEGYRYTNNDLAAYLRDLKAGSTMARKTMGGDAIQRYLPPCVVVVVAAEANRDLFRQTPPVRTLSELNEQWTEAVVSNNGSIWEQADGSMLAVWVARSGLQAGVQRAVRAAISICEKTRASGFRPCIGLSPGVARISAETQRPEPGWELAGPFYLARWMMNFSAHRGEIILSEVAKRQIDRKTQQLGQISIQKNRYINLYELTVR